MFHVHHIDTLDDSPDLEPYRTMRRPLGHVKDRLFVAEGDKVVQRLLESDFEVISAIMPEHCLPALEPLLQARPENLPVYIVPLRELDKMVGFHLYQGVMAVARFPTPLSLDQILARSPQPRLLLALDGLANAENLGVIIRNAAAFGVQALIAGETCATPYLRRSVRNSMGTIFKLPVVESPDLVAALRTLRVAGVKCVAAHGSARGLTLSQCDLRGDCCILLGSEGHGLSPAALEACDEHVSIPMALDVDSINVSNASAVFLYEAARQRGRM